jgi:hypothetical protein
MHRIGRVEQNTRMLNAKELAVFGDAGNVIGVVQVILDVFSPDTLWDLSAKKTVLLRGSHLENLLLKNQARVFIFRRKTVRT